MSTPTPNDRIEKACEEAKEKLEKLDIEEKVVSELEFVLGSYRHDGNPVGLYEIGEKALKALSKYKDKNPRAVSKKLIESLDKAIKARVA